MRRTININNDWKFTKNNEIEPFNKAFNDEKWETVTIPHTWNAIDGANGFKYYTGACWYRKEFFIDSLAKGNKIFIEFNGSNSITDVYVNENYVGQHKGGYSVFRFDITEYVEYGTLNQLSVKVDNTVVDDVYPQKADFTFYGGIYRDVNIIISNPVHFDLMDYGSQGVYIVQEDISKDKAYLKIKTKLVNANEEEKKIRLWVNILNLDGKIEAYNAKEISLKPGETNIIELPIIIENPTLWNGREKPYLYKAKMSLQSFNDTIDELSIPFGVRYFHVDSKKGFFLNGEHLALKGVSRHQDRKDMGWAITKKEEMEDMELIKEIGATSIRLAHYQHNQHFYDLCDQEGMIVWAEIPFISVMSKMELEGLNAKQQMTELIRQNYNHPSIMFWGIQNEIQIGGDRHEVRKIVRELNELTKKEDPTRLSTMANMLMVGDTDEYNYITDVVGYNKYYGWYLGKAEDFAEWLDTYHHTNPGVGLCISEYGAEGILQYHSNEPEIKDYSEEYHALYHEKVWSIFEKRPFLWATYVWNMFDFGANIRDEGGVKGRNNKGLVTYDRKIKKDAFYMYKAHWSNEKFVHINSKRFVDRVDDQISIKVYSNCNEITLYVNGKEIKTKTGNSKIFIFYNVALQEGNNTIKVRTKQEGALVEDIAMFNKVSQSNLSYELPEEGKGDSVNNWFQLPDFSDVEIEPIEISDDVYSTRCTFGELLENKEATAVLRRYLSKFMDNPMFEMNKGFTIDSMSSLAEGVFTDQFMYVLNKELTQIKK